MPKRFSPVAFRMFTCYEQKVLPETFTEGFPDKEGKKDAPITFWGVVIDPWKAAEDARVSVILMKFLRAR